MLLNVRLGPEEQKIVRGLRRRKINVSALVRRGLAKAAADLLEEPRRSPAEEIEAIVREIPAKVRRGRPPLDDRRKVRAFIQKKLRRK